ncbi:MAG: transposase [Planctomycetes bacterium]|nr:transposase [Planctomycetota bacterium]
MEFWPCLWVFTRVAGAEPTNNSAERAARPAVLWRKGCFGLWSATGARLVERMLTVVATLRKQEHAVLDFLARLMPFKADLC